MIVVLIASAVAISLRFLPQPTLNFSAMGALALLCGAAVRPMWLGLLVPLACRVITDGVLQYRTGHGFYGSIMFDYCAYAAVVMIGRTLAPRQLPAVIGTGVLAAITFFVVSNFGVWCLPHDGQYLYAHTMSGLAECFVNAIPFAKGTFLGDIGFSLAFFGMLNLFAAKSEATETSDLKAYPKSV